MVWLVGPLPHLPHLLHHWHHTLTHQADLLLLVGLIMPIHALHLHLPLPHKHLLLLLLVGRHLMLLSRHHLLRVVVHDGLLVCFMKERRSQGIRLCNTNQALEVALVLLKMAADILPRHAIHLVDVRVRVQGSNSFN